MFFDIMGKIFSFHLLRQLFPVHYYIYIVILPMEMRKLR